MSRQIYRATWIGLVWLLSFSTWSETPPASVPESPALVAGKAALEDGLYSVAEKEFELGLRNATTPEERVEGTLLLARALFGQQKYDQVITLLDRRAEWAVGTPYAADFVFWKACARYEQGGYADALQMVGGFRSRFPESGLRPPVARLRTKCYLKLKQFDLALELFSRIEDAYPDAPETPLCMLDWAGTLIDLNQGEDARKVLIRLVEKFPKAEAAVAGRMWLARIYMDREEWPRAQGLLQDITAMKDISAADQYSASLALAELQEKQNNLAEAAGALARAAGTATNSEAKLQADVARGRLLVRMGRPDDGLAILRESARAYPSSALSSEAQLSVAQILLDQRDFEKAAEEYRHYLEAFFEPEGVARAWMGLAWSLWGLQHFAESADAFEKAYSLFKDPAQKAEALFKAADAFFADAQYQSAEDRYRKVAADYPASAWANQAGFQAGECLMRRKMYQEAEKLFGALADASRPNPLAGEAQIRLAQIKEQEGQWEQALSLYDSLTATCTGEVVCARALHGRGLVRYRLGFFKDALEDFETVVKKYPKSLVAEQAWYMRGWCRYLLGDDQEALELCRQFLSQYPQSLWAPDVLFWLGEYYYNHDNFEEAEKQFVDLVTEFPQGPLADDALFWAGRSASRKKDFLKAVEYFNKMAQKYPDSSWSADARFAQGDALSELGQFAAAILAFEEIINKYPDSHLVDLAWGRKGDAQFTMGSEDPARYAEAAASYRMVLESPRADPVLRWQAEYKIGRCREKAGQSTEAFDHYMRVVYTFLAQKTGRGSAGVVWFTRAAFDAAAIKEASGQWREAMNIYRRVVQSGLPAADEAKLRLEKIQVEHRELF